MNWQFWLAHPSSAAADNTDGCENIRPLLSLMSDGLAAPAETRRADAHLAVCPACRQAQAWMDATHLAITERPTALPPADMRARIARAIAASAETALPVVPIAARPAARTFILRPAFAAALSLAVAGAFLGHALLPGRHTATPPVTVTAPIKALPAPVVARAHPVLSVRKAPAPRMAVLPRAPKKDFPHPALPAARPPLDTRLAAVPSHPAPPAVPFLTAIHPRTETLPERAILRAVTHKTFIARRPVPTAPARVLTVIATNPPVTPPASSVPAVAETPAPLVKVARAETPSPTRALSGDALSGIRALLPSRHDDYGRRLGMDTTGVVHTASFVQMPMTHLSDPPAKSSQ